MWEEGVAKYEVAIVPSLPVISSALIREDGGAGSEGGRLCLEKEGKKNVVLMFVFLFSTTWTSYYIFILASNKLFPLSWNCLACDDN